MQAFMYGQIGIIDGTHIGFLILKMLYRIALEIFNAFPAGVLLFCLVLV